MAKKRKRVTKKEAPKRRPVTRRSGYSYADDAATRTTIPTGDYTMKPGVNVEIVRPDWNELDCLIFRPLPCLTDNWEDIADARYMKYRISPERNQFTDWWRCYPAVNKIGIGKDRCTFLMYDPHEAKNDPEFDRSQLPYVLLYDWVRDAKKKKRLPNMDWLDLIDGRDKVLKAPTYLFFVQGLIFKRGAQVYVAEGQSPKGARKDDLPQIIELTKKCGQDIERMLNEINEDFEGDPEDYPRSMRYGDPVSPRHGKFIRLQNPEKGSTGVSSEDIGESWQMGGDSYSQRGSQGRQEIFGYSVSIDDTLVMNNNVLPMKPTLPANVAKAMKPRIVFWDEILRVPTIPEQCLILAKTLRSARQLFEWAWGDHPEYFTDDIRSILSNAHQVFIAESEQELRRRKGLVEAPSPEMSSSMAGAETMAGSVPDDDEYEDDEYEDEYYDDEEEGTAEQENVVEQDGIEVESEGSDDDAEYEEEEEPEVTAATSTEPEETSQEEDDGYYDDDEYEDEAGGEEEAEASEPAEKSTAPEKKEDDDLDLGAFPDESDLTEEDRAVMERARKAAETRSSNRGAKKGAKKKPVKKKTTRK